jgi:hypothetical protein
LLISSSVSQLFFSSNLKLSLTSKSSGSSTLQLISTSPLRLFSTVFIQICSCLALLLSSSSQLGLQILSSSYFSVQFSALQLFLYKLFSFAALILLR